MTWDTVPWFVGGGAQHSPEIARLLAHAATGAAEGIATPDDLKVVTLAVPGSSVRALAGACLIPNRAAGGAQQTYIGRNPSEDVVAVSATGAGSGRCDLVVARVEDPFMAGEPWQDPADVTVGPYIFTRVLPNVGAAAIATHDAAVAYLVSHGFSAIPLAGLDIPQNTATITEGIIHDLREVARPRRLRVQKVSAEPPVDQRLSSASFARWISTATWSVAVPAWATRAVIRMDVANAIHAEADVFGTLGLYMGATLCASNPYAEDWNGATTRSSQVAVNDYAIPSVARGTTQTFALYALRSTASGYLTTDAQTRVILDIEFIEQAA